MYNSLVMPYGNFLVNYGRRMQVRAPLVGLIDLFLLCSTYVATGILWCSPPPPHTHICTWTRSPELDLIQSWRWGREKRDRHKDKQKKWCTEFTEIRPRFYIFIFLHINNSEEMPCLQFRHCEFHKRFFERSVEKYAFSCRCRLVGMVPRVIPVSFCVGVYLH